jgi:hypothetical protein
VIPVEEECCRQIDAPERDHAPSSLARDAEELRPQPREERKEEETIEDAGKSTSSPPKATGAVTVAQKSANLDESTRRRKVPLRPINCNLLHDEAHSQKEADQAYDADDESPELLLQGMRWRLYPFFTEPFI